jgi:hypothetical protein
MSGYGTSRTCRHCSLMSAIGGRPDNICSMRVFRILTPSPTYAVQDFCTATEPLPRFIGRDFLVHIPRETSTQRKTVPLLRNSMMRGSTVAG